MMATAISQRYFAEYAERLRDQGYHPLPVRPQEKVPALKGWQRWCSHRPSTSVLESLIAGKPDYSVGLACGESIIAVDIDVEEAGYAVEVENQTKKVLGDTQLVRIGKEPKRLLIYRPAEEIRSASWATDHGYRIDLLGNKRQMVAFGLHPTTGRPYCWPRETPLEVHRDQLPAITAVQCAELRRATEVPVGVPGGTTVVEATADGTSAAAGGRNDTLFRLCKDAAQRFDTVEGLEAFAVEMNRSTFDLPLPEAEVLRCAHSVWRYKIEGRLILPGQRAAVIRSDDRQALKGEPVAMMLLVYIREHHPPHHVFSVSPEALSPILGLCHVTIRKARDVLLREGLLVRVHAGLKAFEPHRYRLGEPHEPHRKILSTIEQDTLSLGTGRD